MMSETETETETEGEVKTFNLYSATPEGFDEYLANELKFISSLNSGFPEEVILAVQIILTTFWTEIKCLPPKYRGGFVMVILNLLTPNGWRL